MPDRLDHTSTYCPPIRSLPQRIMDMAGRLLPCHYRVRQLEAENYLLTSYSSDTVYRLAYDKMAYDYISPAVTRLLGFTPEEMKKLHFRSLIIESKLITDGIHQIHSFEDLEKARKEGRVDRWQADYLVRTKDGRKIWLTDISVPWFNHKGDIIGSVGSLRNITQRVEAEEKMRQEMIKMAHTDSMTGLGNRRAFFEAIENERKRLVTHRRNFSILLIDIDYFKHINDTYGHDAGDSVLIDVANIIRSCVRDSDLAARVGGEEFGVFLPDTPTKGGYYVADRICRTINAHRFTAPGQTTPLNVTVSIGISNSEDEESSTVQELYKHADMRLYIAKHTGRNQVSNDELVTAH